jgi:transposase
MICHTQHLTVSQAFPGQGNPIEAELTALKRELADVKMERDILKKAVGIFSKDQK